MPIANTLLLQSLGLLALVVLSVAPIPFIVSLLRRGRAGGASLHPASDRLLVAFTIWSVTECALVSTLGWAGRLRLPWMLLLGAILLASGLLLRAYEQIPERPRLSGPLRILHDLGNLDRLLVAVLAGIGCLLAAQLSMFPIADIDSLSYQLPRVVQWYQSGHFHDPMPQHGSLVNSYPFAWNMLFLLSDGTRSVHRWDLPYIG